MGSCSSCCKNSGYSAAAHDEPRKYSKDFNGPVDNRSCTDVFCCILFVVFLMIFSIVAIWSFAMGDVRKFAYPTDSNGKLCGIDYPDRKYLVFFDLTRCINIKSSLTSASCPTEQVCVKQCPDYYWSYNGAPDNAETRAKMICRDDRNALDPEFSSMPISKLVEKELCAPFTFNSAQIFRRCMPKLLADAVNTGSSGNASMFQYLDNLNLYNTEGVRINRSLMDKAADAFLKIFSYVEPSIHNLQKNWYIVVTCLVASAIFCLLYIVLMRFFTKLMVWVTLILFFLLFVALTGFSFFRYWQLKRNETNEQWAFLYKLGASFQLPRTWLIIGLICLTILIVLLVILIFLRKRITMAIAIIEETSKGLANMLSAILWPLIPYVLILAVILLVFFVFIHLKTVTDNNEESWETVANDTSSSSKDSLKKVFRSLPCNTTAEGRRGEICRFIGYGGKKYIIVLEAFTIFMGYWMLNFVTAFHEMTLAGAFAYFYFRRTASKTTFPILASARNALFYHMGTLAFGALIVSIVQFIRTILQYIDHKLKSADNSIAKFLLKCFTCCLYCLEKVLKFINRNAYIMTAIYSQNFCTAAANAFSLIARNLVRVFVLDKVADFVFLLARLVVIAASMATYYMLCKGHVTFPEHALSFAIVVVGSYLIGRQFFDVFVMGVDTIFLCVLEDLERNDGSPEKPYMMSKGLMKALEVRNTPPADEKAKL